MNRVYFIGIGGIGMSALARYFKAQKWAVSGSDAAKSSITAGLTKDGINVKIGHKKGNLPANTDPVIVSQAIRADNPELKEARRRGLRVLTYPEAVGELTEQYRTVAVAGAHGKSTTTALTALILIKAGLDPTVIVGTNLREFGDRNFRKGHGSRGNKDGYLVLEADEFGNAFSHYSPAIAVITNIDREHLEIFKNLAGIKKAFVGFIENVSSGGALILNRDDKNLWSLRKMVSAIAKRKSLRVIWHSNRGTTAKKIRKVINVPGEHNIANAIGAYKAGRVLGIPHEKILAAIGSYQGAWRRMEYRGELKAGNTKGAAVYDDYAHHPTEIRATLRALKEKYQGKRVLCVFQPHLSERLHALFKEFVGAFDHADETLILPIYKVAGRHTSPGRYDSQALARAIQKKQPKKLLFYLENQGDIKKAVLALSNPRGPSPLSKKIIVLMGAGNIVDYTDKLLE